MRRRAIAAFVFAACTAEAAPDPAGRIETAAPLAGSIAALPSAALPSHRRCDASAAAVPGQGFRHRRSAVVARGEPRHFAQDAVAPGGATVELAVKISYGEGGKDLEDELVEIRMDSCDGIRVQGQATTDDDGWARLAIAAPMQPGSHALAFRVLGDGTTTRARLHVLPPTTELVVFDIDGTLTTSDGEVARDAFDERTRETGYDAAPYAHGDELARLWADRGFVPVYLTGRPYWLVDHTRAWLDAHGFPPGVVQTTTRHRDCAPTVAGVGTFKADWIAGLRLQGYEIVAAYGNAVTDIWAYAQNQIPPARTFIIGPHGGEGGTVAVMGDWSAALPFAREHARAEQPFVWPR